MGWGSLLACNSSPQKVLSPPPCCVFPTWFARKDRYSSAPWPRTLRAAWELYSASISPFPPVSSLSLGLRLSRHLWSCELPPRHPHPHHPLRHLLFTRRRLTLPLLRLLRRSCGRLSPFPPCKPCRGRRRARERALSHSRWA